MEGPIDDSAMFELLGKFLAQECNAQESAQVADWIAARPENRQSFEAIKAVWEQAEAPDIQAQGREDAAWARLQARMQAPQADETPIVPLQKTSQWSWMRIAAMLVVVLSIGVVIYLNQIRRNPLAEMQTFAAGEFPRRDTLPDGTVVQLNAHSKLICPAVFAAGERVVELEGEAFFEVAHNAAQPFRIHAGAADVRVLGTSFNLMARGDSVRVAVETGLVELASNAGSYAQKLMLPAGEVGSYSGKSKAMRQAKSEVENDQYWRTGTLVFRDAALQRVVAQLNAVFTDSIVLSPNLANCPLSTSFVRPSIDSAVMVIAETFDLQITHNGNVYQLDGAGCQ